MKMRVPSNRSVLPALLLALTAGCGDDDPLPVGPELRSERTLLVHLQGSGENRLLNTDGSPAGTLTGTDGLVPIGAHAGEGVVALLGRDALMLGTLSQPGVLDTVLRPIPGEHSLAAFSDDGRQVAVVALRPFVAVLVYDRVERTIDTLLVEKIEPVLPPIFSPDGKRIALISVTELSVYVTLLDPEQPQNAYTRVLNFSKFTNALVFGWPRWIGEGIRMVSVRPADDAPDTLIVGSIYPDAPWTFPTEHYRAVLAPVSDERPELQIGPLSTYNLTQDGTAVALAAVPGTGLTPHALYYVTPDVDRVQLIRDAAGEYPVLPLFIRD